MARRTLWAITDEDDRPPYPDSRIAPKPESRASLAGGLIVVLDDSTRLHVSVPQDPMISSVMNASAYPRGRLAAQKAHEYFSRYREQLPDTSRECIASVPSADVIEAVIDAAFWASLRREEGYMPRLSLAILDPEQARQPLLFENGLPLTPDSLCQAAPPHLCPVGRPSVND